MDAPLVRYRTATRRRLVVRLALEMTKVNWEFLLGNTAVPGPDRGRHGENGVGYYPLPSDCELQLGCITARDCAECVERAVAAGLGARAGRSCLTGSTQVIRRGEGKLGGNVCSMREGIKNGSSLLLKTRRVE
jgi:hypothetical protein